MSLEYWEYFLKIDNRSTKVGQLIFKNRDNRFNKMRTDLQKWDNQSKQIGQPIHKNEKTETLVYRARTSNFRIFYFILKLA